MTVFCPEVFLEKHTENQWHESGRNGLHSLLTKPPAETSLYTLNSSISEE